MKPTTKSWILLLLALFFASPGSPMTWAAGRTLPVQQKQSTGKPMKTVAEDWDERLQVRTKVQVSADTVLIAEPLEVVVQIQHPADTDVEFAKPQDNWGDLQIENVADQMNQLTGDGHRTSTRRLQAEAWQSGKLQVPQLSFDLVTRTTSDGSEGTGDASLKTDSRQVWRTPEWSIQVVSSRTPEEAEGQLRGLADTLDAPVPPPTSKIWWYAGASAVALAALALGLVAWRKRPAAESEVPLAVWARLRLRELRAEGSARDTPSVADRWATASSVVRDYFGLRFGLNVTAGTADEVLRQMTDDGWSPGFLKRLEAWLREAEQVNFAGIEPRQEDFRSALDRAEALVGQAEAMLPVLDQNDQPATPEMQGGE